MKSFIIVTVLVGLCQSCVQKKENNLTSALIGIITSQSDSSLKSLKQLTEERGNKTEELDDFTMATKYSKICRSIVKDISSNGGNLFEDRIDSLIKEVENETTALKDFEDFIYQCVEERSVENLKIGLTLFETQIIKEFSKRIGATDISFDKLDLVLLPDKYLKKREESFTGKLVLVATSTQLNSIGKYKLNGQKIEENNIEITRPGIYKGEVEVLKGKFNLQFKVLEK